ncbi:hypothetical protein ACJMK2_023406 [Sinanodonta woodiana]|uniref:Kinesin-like protein 6 n=1 Tax=Sinanodonta woodiana TaxID=1069815 RepID=A0ABD3T4U4_SINWO
MHGNSTEIFNPENLDAEPKRFAFDYSYWSHDGFNELADGYMEPASSQYADQRRVFDDLGRGVLDNAWKGYNCSLFAYGQTGSGKSYSMVGYGANKGIVPIFCDELFKGIEDKRATAGENEDYQVMVSMLEIYNEQVRDLLNAESMHVKGGLKVRQHPKMGFYVESLTSSDVNSYKEIDNRINDGTRNRTVAATNMNATSSRAHTIVAITFVQKSPNQLGQNMTRTSIVNLVDLAGSERADSTGATGDRLKEGSAINQSLSTLGNVIKALAEQSTGKKKIVGKFLIAALSPADINYDETLSTLRFADRAKAIKTTATINESPTDKLIRELREENARLMEMLKAGGVPLEQQQQSKGGYSPEEVEEMKRALEEELRRKQEEISNMSKSWQERMHDNAVVNQAQTEQDSKREADRKVIPHFWNLNEDPALTAMVIHFCNTGTSRIGNKSASPKPEILLNGLSIQKEHAVVSNSNNKVTLKPQPGATILVNGTKIGKETELHHNDRVSFGPNHLFVFHHPQDMAKRMNEGTLSEETPTFESAQEEIAKESGLMTSSDGMSKEDLILQEELVQILPMVSEANAMSTELGKKKSFEIVLVSPQSMGKKDGKTEVMVKMTDKETGNDWTWGREKFINRKFIMQEMYQNFLDDDKNWDLPQDRDPFWEPDDMEKLIGSSMFILQSLSYKIDADETLSITNHKGQEQGHMEVEMVPCNEKGQALSEDDFVDDPSELVGNPLHFKIKIKCLRGLPSNIETSFCKYKFYLDNKEIITDEVSGTINPNFDHEKLFSFKTVTNQLVDYLTDGSLHIEVWGKQKNFSKGKTSAPSSKTPEKKVTPAPVPVPSVEKKVTPAPVPVPSVEKKDIKDKQDNKETQEKNGAVTPTPTADPAKHKKPTTEPEKKKV